MATPPFGDEGPPQNDLASQVMMQVKSTLADYKKKHDWNGSSLENSGGIALWLSEFPNVLSALINKLSLYQDEEREMYFLRVTDAQLGEALSKLTLTYIYAKGMRLREEKPIQAAQADILFNAEKPSEWDTDSKWKMAQAVTAFYKNPDDKYSSPFGALLAGIQNAEATTIFNRMMIHGEPEHMDETDASPFIQPAKVGINISDLPNNGIISMRQALGWLMTPPETWAKTAS